MKDIMKISLKIGKNKKNNYKKILHYSVKNRIQ